MNTNRQQNLINILQQQRDASKEVMNAIIGVVNLNKDEVTQRVTNTLLTGNPIQVLGFKGGKTFFKKYEDLTLYYIRQALIFKEGLEEDNKGIKGIKGLKEFITGEELVSNSDIYPTINPFELSSNQDLLGDWLIKRIQSQLDMDITGLLLDSLEKPSNSDIVTNLDK